MVNTSYYKACDRAYNFSAAFFTDIVHDAFIEWHDKTKRNLFDEKEEIITNMIKKVYWKKYFGKKKSVVFTDRIKQNLETPEDVFIRHENQPWRFTTYAEITQSIDDYEQYHTFYPKINLN